MEIIEIDKYKFIRRDFGKAHGIFLTGENSSDFNLANPESKAELSNIKRIFGLEDIGYSKQVHSDIVNIYDSNIYEGDAIITDKRKIGVGVFTADCVPVLVYDKRNNVCAAIHSGWKGTYNKITLKTITKLKDVYGSKCDDLYVVIGPHIKQCCYEVGPDLINIFKSDNLYAENKIADGRKLNLQYCIETQCVSSGIPEDNISSIELCTYCSSDIKLHSYRREKEKSGRNFSFIYIDEA